MLRQRLILIMLILIKILRSTLTKVLKSPFCLRKKDKENSARAQKNDFGLRKK